MRDFLKLVMYSGVVLAIIAFVIPYLDYRLGNFTIPAQYVQYMSWAALALVVIGFVGRRVTDSES